MWSTGGEIGIAGTARRFVNVVTEMMRRSMREVSDVSDESRPAHGPAVELMSMVVRAKDRLLLESTAAGYYDSNTGFAPRINYNTRTPL